MTCPEAEIIAGLANGSLSEADEQNVRAHVNNCPTCARVLAEIHTTWEALGVWELEQPAPDVKDRVLRTVIAEARQARHPGWGLPLAVRAAASIAVALGLGIAAGHLVPTSAAHAPALQHADVEALERALTLVSQFSESPTGLSLGLGDPAASTEEAPS